MTADLVFSTSGMPSAERLPSLRAAVRDGFLDLSVRPLLQAGAQLDGFVHVRDLGGMRVARFGGSPVVATRTHGHLARADTDDYLLALHTRGIARAAQSGRQITLRPGDFALLDSSRPYTIELANSGPFEHIAYQIPRARLDARAADSLERALAFRVPVGSDPGSLASPYLQTLASAGWRTPASAAAPLIETGLDLLVGALLMAAGQQAPASFRQGELLQRLKRHALERLGDPELAPGAVAAIHFMSVRQLHRLFAREGETFGAWVREQRLGRARRDLADPRLAGASIAELSARWGFRSAAHFTRAFSARYGVGPRDFRRAAASRRPALVPERPAR
jgi:AraC-like DNA-binding protein